MKNKLHLCRFKGFFLLLKSQVDACFWMDSFTVKEKMYPFEIGLQSSKSSFCPTHDKVNPSQVDK